MQQESVNRPSYTFTKKERICSKTLFEEIIRNRQSFSIYPLKCYFLINRQHTSLLPNQIAISVPKRKVHSAVHRNKIKRLIREAYRLNKNILSEGEVESSTQYQMIIVFIGKSIPSFKTINDKIITILKRLSQMATTIS